MIALRLLPLLCLASADYWPGFKTTFGPVPGVGDAFKDRPRTATDAEAAGWQLIDSCNGVWLGSRYGDPADPSLVMIYDVAGYIAGVQSGLRLADCDLSVNPVDTMDAYQTLESDSDFFGEPVYFTTVYFSDPAVICNGGRTEEDFQADGTGDRLTMQLGATPDTTMDVPLTQEAADADSVWYDHYCFVAMGDHYLQFDYTPDQACTDPLPLQLIFNEGVLNGFVWQHIATLPGTKWEHPDINAIGVIVDRPPTCIPELIAYPGLSTMHHFFYDTPWLTVCPLKYDRRSVSGYKNIMKL